MENEIKTEMTEQKTETSEQKEKRRIPKKCFDAEYSTQRFKEYQFLIQRGFVPSYIAITTKYEIKTFKYTKTPELFLAVADFYKQLREEKTNGNN